MFQLTHESGENYFLDFATVLFIWNFIQGTIILNVFQMIFLVFHTDHLMFDNQMIGLYH